MNRVKISLDEKNSISMVGHNNDIKWNKRVRLKGTTSKVWDIKKDDELKGHNYEIKSQNHEL